MAAFYQRCSDETRPDVGNVYVANALDVAKVSEHLKSLLMSSGGNPGINYDIVGEI